MKPQFNYRMPLAVCLLSVTGIVGMFVRAHAQTMGVGGQPASKFALQVSDCPTVTTGYNLCPVVPLNGQPFLAMSVAGYNNGAPFQIVSQGIQGAKGDTGATGAQGPAGPQGPPGANATAPVTSVNGKTGAVVITLQ